ncbi:MAG: hypothetical protein AAF628_27540 [Planctomycetota bacterium]
MIDEIEAAIADGLRQALGLTLSCDVECRTALIARRWFEDATDFVAEQMDVGVPGIEVDVANDTLIIGIDTDQVSETFRRTLPRGLRLRLRLRREARRLRLAFGPKASLPSEPASPPERDRLVQARWAVPGIDGELTRVRAVMQDLPGRAWERCDAPVLRVAQSALRTGNASVSVTAEGLVARAAHPTTSRTTLGATGLLRHIPTHVELWGGSGAESVAQAASSVLALAADAARQMRRDVASPTTHAQSEVRLLLDAAKQLRSAVDVFEKGWVFFGTADGWTIVQPGEPYASGPAFAVLARPKTAAAGMHLARVLLEEVGSQLGCRVVGVGGGLELVPIAAASFIGRGLTLRAEMLGDVLLIATSDLLAERIRAGGPDDASFADSVHAWRTSGWRLGQLGRVSQTTALDIMASLGASAQARQSVWRRLEATREILSVFGEIEFSTRRVGDTEVMSAIARLAAAEVASSIEHSSAEGQRIAKAVRSALRLDRVSDELVLVGRGRGTQDGSPVDLKLAYAGDGRFREVFDGPRRSEVVAGPTGVLEDRGWGLRVLGPSNEGWARSLAAAVSGAWAREGSGFSTRLIETSADAIILGLRARGDPIERRLLIDPACMLPRRLDCDANGALSNQYSLELSDYRRAAGRLLPHRITSLAAGSESTIDSWTTEAVDDEQFLAVPKPYAGFTGTEAVEIEVDDAEQLWIEGRAGAEEGWFSLQPLLESASLFPDVFDALVASNEHTVAGDTIMVTSGVEVGPLRADRFKFSRSSQHQDFGERRVLGYVGTPILEGTCVTFDLQTKTLRLGPPGSLGGEHFEPMCTISGHRAFACTLPDGSRSWFAPFNAGRSVVWIKDWPRRQFLARAQHGNGPLRDGRLPWLDAAGMRLQPTSTQFDSQPGQPVGDATPLAVAFQLIGGTSLEMDFPNRRYRLRPR